MDMTHHSFFCMMTASTTQRGEDNYLVSKWLDVLRPTFQKFLDEMSWKCEVDIKPDGLWINKYNKHEHQEFHNHSMPSCNLSMVYFHRCEEMILISLILNGNSIVQMDCMMW